MAAAMRMVRMQKILQSTSGTPEKMQSERAARESRAAKREEARTAREEKERRQHAPELVESTREGFTARPCSV